MQLRRMNLHHNWHRHRLVISVKILSFPGRLEMVADAECGIYFSIEFKIEPERFGIELCETQPEFHVWSQLSTPIK